MSFLQLNSFYIFVQADAVVQELDCGSVSDSDEMACSSVISSGSIGKACKDKMVDYLTDKSLRESNCRLFRKNLCGRDEPLYFYFRRFRTSNQ